MGYEIDFIRVGEGERGGDAIAMRFGELMSGDPRRWEVFVVDGGTKESGKKLVDHIKKYYDTEVVTAAICTHPDQDHASGLTEVLTGLHVSTLWMHLPWEHSTEVLTWIQDGRVTDESAAKRLWDSLRAAKSLYETALEKETRIFEPFAGDNIAHELIDVLGPTKEYYEELVAQFPEFSGTTTKSGSGILDGLERLKDTVLESLDVEKWVRKTGPVAKVDI